MIGQNSDRLNILLALLAVAILLTVFGASAYTLFGDAGVTVLDLAISAVLSAALVILYFRQTTILESQRNLLTQELNREARQHHTETLRERVRIWHGNPDKETAENPLNQPDMNLPRVLGASFKSAPTGIYAALSPEEEPFQVVPDQLQGDRYLNDLLQNHAPDLREKKEEIERLHSRFVSLREEFKEEYNGDVVEKEEYTLHPADFFTRWIFELVIRLNRGDFEDFDELREQALPRIESGDTGLHPDKPWIWIRVDRGGGRALGIYSARTDSYDREELQELRPDAKEDVQEVARQATERIDEDYPYELAHEAAEILDDAEEAVLELERILEEYEGRPIYPGDCKYLEEARI